MGKKFGYVLGGVMITVTLIVILDHLRQTAQMHALAQVLTEDTKSRQALQAEVKNLGQQVTVLQTTTQGQAQAAMDLGTATTAWQRALVTHAAGTTTLAVEIASLRDALAAGVAISTPLQQPTPGTGTPTMPGTTNPPPDADDPPPVASDGLPCLDRNFLLPSDLRFDPQKLRGTRRDYNETPKGLNSLLENASTNSAIDELVNDSLAERDRVEPMRWRSKLATSCIITDDYRTFTFTLRKGVFWHVPSLAQQSAYAFLRQPVELTADDFAFYVEMLRDPAVECSHLKVYYEKLEKAEAVDRYTLRLIWSEKLYTNLDSSLGLAPLPRHLYSIDSNGQAYAPGDVGRRFNENHWFDAANQHIGVGPYRLVAYQSDEEMRFARNPDYWGATQHFQEIVLNLQVKDPSSQLTGFKNGDVHTFGLSPQFYRTEILDGTEPRFAKRDPHNPKAGRSGELGWEQVKGQAYSYIGWNMHRPLFADKRVRQAMSHAFPREDILKVVYMGLGEPLNTNVHPDSPYANHDLPPYTFSLAKAARLLAEAGWEDRDQDGWLDREIDGVFTPFRFEAKIYEHSKEWPRVMDIYREQLKKIGIDMTVKALEWKDLLKVYEDKDFDAISGGWQMGYEVDFKQLWDSTEADKPGSSNHCGFKNAQADALIERMRRTFDFAERVRIAKAFQVIIHEEQPYTFFRSSEGIFVWQNQSDGKRQGLAGVTEALDALHPFYNRDPHWWFFRE